MATAIDPAPRDLNAEELRRVRDFRLKNRLTLAKVAARCRKSLYWLHSREAGTYPMTRAEEKLVRQAIRELAAPQVEPKADPGDASAESPSEPPEADV